MGQAFKHCKQCRMRRFAGDEWVEFCSDECANYYMRSQERKQQRAIDNKIERNAYLRAK